MKKRWIPSLLVAVVFLSGLLIRSCEPYEIAAFDEDLYGVWYIDSASLDAKADGGTFLQDLGANVVLSAAESAINKELAESILTKGGRISLNEDHSSYVELPLFNAAADGEWTLDASGTSLSVTAPISGFDDISIILLEEDRLGLSWISDISQFEIDPPENEDIKVEVTVKAFFYLF